MFGGTFDFLDWLLTHSTPPATAVDPHLVVTLREAFAAWAAARSLSQVMGAPGLRYAGRLENRDVEVAVGVGHDERGAVRVGACLVLVACPELTPLVQEPILIGGPSTAAGDAPDAMLLLIMQNRPAILSVALAVNAVCVRLAAASGPSVVDRTMADLDVVLRGIHAGRVKGTSAGPYRSS